MLAFLEILPRLQKEPQFFSLFGASRFPAKINVSLPIWAGPAKGKWWIEARVVTGWGLVLKTSSGEVVPQVCFSPPTELQTVHQGERRGPTLCLHAPPVLTALLPSLATIPATELAIIMKTGLNSDRDHYI